MKPMLASPAGAVIRFPVLASPKIDGIRAIIHDGVALSRSLKPIRNRHVQHVLSFAGLLNGLDGELVVGDPNDPNCMQNTTSGVMRETGEPYFTFHVFDKWDLPSEPYTWRAKIAAKIVKDTGDGRVRFLVGFPIADQAALDAYEAQCLADGYEGVMIRDPHGLYKFGRATAKSGELLKIKRFVDDEAVVIGVEELMHNENEAQDERVRAHGAQHGEGRAPFRAGVLGKLIVPHGQRASSSACGTGFTAAQRTNLWHDHHTGHAAIVGKLVTYKHFANAGVKDAPRFPVFKAFRDASDLS
jgi:DNA ligase-1